MIHDPTEPPRPDDPKAALEDHLISQAMEPYRARLCPEELAGMRLFLRAFVKTHPTMQGMIARRLTEEAFAELSQVATGVRARLPDASGVVTKEQGAGSPARSAPEASSVVAKDQEIRGPGKAVKRG